MQKRWLVMLLAPAALSATPALAGSNPTLKVSPKQVTAGSRVTVSGTNWGQEIAQECANKIKLYLITDPGEVSTRITSVRTNGAQLTFSQRIPIPSSIAPGKYVLKAAQKCSAEDSGTEVGRAKTGLTVR